MVYSVGGLIQRDDYNTFATGSVDGSGTAQTLAGVANINSVWGSGYGDSGYGQATTLSTVAAGDVVTATQWSTLLARLNSILTHQAGSGSGLTSPTAGVLITHLTTLSTQLTTARTNRLNFNSTRGTPSTTNYDATWNAPTPTSFQQVRTVTFASADAARYFFNAGGRIGISLSVPAGGGGNAKETAWGNLLGTGIGTLNFDATTSARTGTGYTLTTNGSAIGFWDLLTTDQTLIRLTETTAAYTANYVEILAKISGAAGTLGGLGTTITFTINYSDGATDVVADDINMTMRAAVTITPPETTNLTSSWGTVTPAATVN